MDRDQLLLRLKEVQGILQHQGVDSLAVFGSFATEKASKESDVDILVSFCRPVGLFGVMEVKEYLENILERSVDLVTPETLHPHLKAKILEEAIRVF